MTNVLRALEVLLLAALAAWLGRWAYRELRAWEQSIWAEAYDNGHAVGVVQGRREGRREVGHGH